MQAVRCHIPQVLVGVGIGMHGDCAARVRRAVIGQAEGRALAAAKVRSQSSRERSITFPILQ
jgi:hypothetical protein